MGMPERVCSQLGQPLNRWSEVFGDDPLQTTHGKGFCIHRIVGRQRKDGASIQNMSVSLQIVSMGDKAAGSCFDYFEKIVQVVHGIHQVKKEGRHDDDCKVPAKGCWLDPV